MPFVLAVLVGGAFGAGDQYLGSLPSLGAWGAPVSLMSAPWPVLPFAFGATQVTARRGALVTGPLFGWLGQRWRTRRALSSATLVAGSLLFEQPLLHLLAGSLRGMPEGAPLATSLAEAGAGAALAAYFLLRRRQFRRTCPAA